MNQQTFNRFLPKLAAILIAISTLGGCAGTANSPKNIVDTAAANGQFTILSKAIKEAGLEETLKGAGPFTVFAPTDAAFNAVPKAQLDKLLADKAALKAVLTYHVIAGKVLSKDVVNGQLTTVNGAKVNVSKSGAYVGFDDALVTKADIEATNGVIHVIDSVAMPPKKK